MIVCPKCQKELVDGSVFCDNCGCNLQQTVFCPNCGRQVPASAAFCPGCGASTTVNVKKKEKTKKEKSSKTPLIIAIIAGVLVVALVAGLLILFAGDKNNALYFKDDEFYYYSFSKGDKFQLSLDLADDVEGTLGVTTALWECTFSEDGKTVFFPDKVDDLTSISSEGYSLYYSRTGKPDGDKVKISSDVFGYQVNKKGDTVTYRKGDDSALYQFYLKDDSNDKIATEVQDAGVSDDGKTIYYLNEDGGLYIWQKGEDKSKIDSEVETIEYVSEKFDLIVYIKENSLYLKRVDAEKEKIASEVDSFVAAYETGEVYYTKENEASVIKMSDILENDDPKNEAVYNSIKDQELDWMDIGKLCYYNGENSEVITDDLIEGSVGAADDNAVALYMCFDIDSFKKFKLSEFASGEDLSEQVIKRFEKACKYYLNVGAEETAIEVDDTIVDVTMDEKGELIYFICGENDGHGDLFQITVDDNKVSDPKLYDSDVYEDFVSFIDDNKIVYYKDVKEDTDSGDLYIEKKKIDYDVYLYSREYIEDKDQYVYFTEWDSEKELGTLRVYNGKKSTKISEDVHDFGLSIDGDILYLYDYSIAHSSGDLFLYKKSGSKKIDMDVVAIVSVEREE